MNKSENVRISGMILQAYCICHRQTWLLVHSIFTEQDNELLSLGRLIDQDSYAREKHQISFGGNKFDFMNDQNGTLVISEIKKSSRAEKASTLQLAHYLYELEKEGIKAVGVLLYPKEKKRTDIILTEELKNTLEDAYCKIKEISQSYVPPLPLNCRFCTKCSYSDYCFG